MFQNENSIKFFSSNIQCLRTNQEANGMENTSMNDLYLYKYTPKLSFPQYLVGKNENLGSISLTYFNYSQMIQRFSIIRWASLRTTGIKNYRQQELREHKFILILL